MQYVKNMKETQKIVDALAAETEQLVLDFSEDLLCSKHDKVCMRSSEGEARTNTHFHARKFY
jgi:hypothetical protein